MFGPVLDDERYVVGEGNDVQIYGAALLELVLIVANIATAIVLYPLMRARFPMASIGYVSARIMECMFIGVGVLAVLAVVTLRSEGSDSDVLPVVAEALVAIKD